MLFRLILDAVFFVSLGRVIWFPAGSWENVFVSLVPISEQDFTSVRFVLLHTGIANQTHIVVDVKTEERTTFTASLEFIKALKFHKNGALVFLFLP